MIVCCDTSTAEYNTTALSPRWASCEKVEESKAGMSVRLVEDLKFIKLMILFRRQRWYVQAGTHSTAVLIDWVTSFLFFWKVFDSCNLTPVFVYLLCPSPL